MSMLVRPVLSAAMSMTPPAFRVAIAGYPDTEENAHVAALAIAAQTRAPVWLLARDPDVARHHLTLVAGWMENRTVPANIRVVRRSRVNDLRAIIRSSVVLYTHGLAGSPAPRGKRLHVNLWHGTGAKRTANQDVVNRIGASCIAGNARHWLRQTADDLRMQSPRLLSGNVRQLLFTTADTTEVAARLNIQAPYVLWMPTYRKTNSDSRATSQDGMDPAQFADFAHQLAAAATRFAVSLVVKPHPLDAFDWQSLGATVVRNADLTSAGVPLYTLLGAAGGLVSDYSSTWVDFLELDRPILLAVPDIDEYASTRGLKSPRLDEFMGESIYRSVGDADRFFRSVASREPADHSHARSVLDYQSLASPEDFMGELREALSVARVSILE